jgi:hypothetical protein
MTLPSRIPSGCHGVFALMPGGGAALTSGYYL